MKLNLLPTTVSKGARTRTAWIISALLVVASTVVTVGLAVNSSRELKKAKAMVEAQRANAEQVVTIAAKADTVLDQAKGIIRNTQLAKAMLDHNTVYPDFYDSLWPYIPSFYRLTSATATPVDAETATVTLTGTLHTYQQYADLMLALMRNPKAVSVTRSGFVSVDPIVPSITSVDQNGRPRKATDSPIPDDKLERLTYFQSQATQPGYSGVGGFGGGAETTKYAMPDWSYVTVTMVVKANLQTPNPRATLSAAGGAAASSPLSGPMGSGMPTGMPPGLAGPPMSRPGAPTGRSGKGSED